MTSTTAQIQNSPFVPSDSIALSLPKDLTEDQLHSFPAFKTWITALLKTLNSQSSPKHPYHAHPYRLHGITVQAIDRFSGGRLGFVKLKADVRTDDGQSFPGSVFLRGGSVAMLLVLKPESGSDDRSLEEDRPVDLERRTDEEYVILTSQPRIPAGTFAFTEIPAGMLDDSGTFSGAAAKEIKEETGLEIEEEELIDMTSLAMDDKSEDSDEAFNAEEVLQKAVYPSPGGSDEFIPLFLVEKRMSRGEIRALQGKLTGLRDHGEKISLKIVLLKDAWKVAGRDAKTLAALYLYEKLQREGKIISLSASASDRSQELSDVK